MNHIGWYHELIPNYATKSLPIIRLQENDVKFEWTHECQEAFDIFKQKLSTYSVLKPSNWDLSFHMFCDASSLVVISTLCQPIVDDGKDYRVADN